MTSKKRGPQPFTEEEEHQIARVVGAKMQPEDREPAIVIATTYKGNKQRWLHDMTHLHPELAHLRRT